MTARQRSVVLMAMAAGMSRAEAAKAASVDTAEVDTLMGDSVFVKELAAARDRVFGDALARLKVGAGRAVSKLLSLINGKSEAESRRACVDVISLAIRVRDADEIERRLDEIESRLAGKGRE